MCFGRNYGTFLQENYRIRFLEPGKLIRSGFAVLKNSLSFCV